VSESVRFEEGFLASLRFLANVRRYEGLKFAVGIVANILARLTEVSFCVSIEEIKKDYMMARVQFVVKKST
jgi:hypothetical protein